MLSTRKVADVIAEQLGVDKEKVTREAWVFAKSEKA